MDDTWNVGYIALYPDLKTFSVVFRTDARFIKIPNISEWE